MIARLPAAWHSSRNYREGMPSELEPATQSLRGAPILIVDSDGPSGRLICAILEDEGCELRVATSGAEALVMVEQRMPRIVLVELKQPDMDGLELVRALKSRCSPWNIVIVAVTTSNGAETKRLALEAGCTDYVRKPIDALSFAARLQSLLGRQLEAAQPNGKRGPET